MSGAMPGVMPDTMPAAKPEDEASIKAEPPPTPLVETMQAIAVTASETPQLVKAELMDVMDRLSKMLLDSCERPHPNRVLCLALSSAA